MDEFGRLMANTSTENPQLQSQQDDDQQSAEALVATLTEWANPEDEAAFGDL